MFQYQGKWTPLQKLCPQQYSHLTINVVPFPHQHILYCRDQTIPYSLHHHRHILLRSNQKITTLNIWDSCKGIPRTAIIRVYHTYLYILFIAYCFELGNTGTVWTVLIIWLINLVLFEFLWFNIQLGETSLSSLSINHHIYHHQVYLLGFLHGIYHRLRPTLEVLKHLRAMLYVSWKI